MWRWRLGRGERKSIGKGRDEGLRLGHCMRVGRCVQSPAGQGSELDRTQTVENVKTHATGMALAFNLVKKS